MNEIMKLSEGLKNDKLSKEKRALQQEFLIKNKIMIFKSRYAYEFDYQIFVECMEVFENTGVNYFSTYEKLTDIGLELNLKDPVKSYCDLWTHGYNRRNSVDTYKNKLKSNLKEMIFFDIDELYGITREDYSKLIENADKDIDNYLRRINKEYDDNKNETNKKNVEEYFCFDNFDEKKAKQVFENSIATIERGENCYLVEDNIFSGESKLTKDYIFITYMYKDNDIVSIGYTSSIMSYVVNKAKQINCDKILYCQVPKELMEYVYINSCKYFNRKIEINIKISDKKYATFNTAKKAYRSKYGMDSRILKKIIQQNDLEEFYMFNEFILDKKKLDNCVIEYLKKNKLK